MAAPLLTFSALTLVRGLRVVVQDFDFALYPGGIYTLIGENGAGKTTLLRVGAGLLQPFAGEVRRAQGTHKGTHKGAQIAYLGHELALKARDRPGDLLNREDLKAWDLHELAQIPIAYLSMGQKKRVALALRCQSQAKLWLFDEPLANLDAQQREWMLMRLAAHGERGGGVIFSAHSPVPTHWPTLTLAGGRVHVG